MRCSTGRRPSGRPGEIRGLESRRLSHRSLGHCSACHSPRNALGAEQHGQYLAGGFAEGWEAPALTSLSQAPIPWSEDELFAYLRTGESRYHGVAAGTDGRRS
jgi:mono/diheme cytochrome c family protein